MPDDSMKWAGAGRGILSARMPRFLLPALTVLCSCFPGTLAKAVAARQAPLEKAKSMLESLRSEVQAEGDKEAETYDKFACFCKDTMSQKSSEVTAGQTLKSTYEAELDQQVVARKTADTEIANAAAAIQQLEAELKELHAERHNESLQYDREQVDLTEAITALQSAIHAIEAAKTATGSALVQLSSVAGTVQQAVAMADVLESTPSRSALKHPDQILVALQKVAEDPTLPEENYAFHSDDVITTLHDLVTKFADKKREIADAETQNRQTYDGLVVEKSNLIKQQQTALATQQTAKATAAARVQTIAKDMSTTSAQLLDDQKYLAEVSSECTAKAELWDGRSKVRVDELQALTAALEILESEAVSGTSLVQIRAHVPSSFVQLQQDSAPAARRIALSSQQQAVTANRSGVLLGRRARVAALLRAKAQGGRSLHGALLLRAAAEAEEDPFAKVKQLIQQLIERLLKEAEQEANHKGWCDENMGMAELARDQQATKIKELNGKLALSEARRAKLTELVASLDDDMLQLQGALNESSTVRLEESAQNKAAIQEAEEARAAVASAIQILSRFYGVKPPASAMSLLQKSRTATANATRYPDMPDAGFSSEYSGAQGGAFGVLGMLEVLMEDFAKTAAQVGAQEKAAEQDFLEFETQTKASLAAKTVAVGQRSASLAEADAEDAADRDALVAAQSAMGQELDELDALYKACVDTSMTAEERKVHREEEIQALQDALAILDNHGIP